MQEPIAPVLAPAPLAPAPAPLMHVPAPAPAQPLLYTINLGDVTAPLDSQQAAALVDAVKGDVGHIPGVSDVAYVGSQVSNQALSSSDYLLLLTKIAMVLKRCKGLSWWPSTS